MSWDNNTKEIVGIYNRLLEGEELSDLSDEKLCAIAPAIIKEYARYLDKYGEELNKFYGVAHTEKELVSPQIVRADLIQQIINNDILKKPTVITSEQLDSFLTPKDTLRILLHEAFNAQKVYNDLNNHDYKNYSNAFDFMAFINARLDPVKQERDLAKYKKVLHTNFIRNVRYEDISKEDIYFIAPYMANDYIEKLKSDEKEMKKEQRLYSDLELTSKLEGVLATKSLSDEGLNISVYPLTESYTLDNLLCDAYGISKHSYRKSQEAWRSNYSELAKACDVMLNNPLTSEPERKEVMKIMAEEVGPYLFRNKFEKLKEKLKSESGIAKNSYKSSIDTNIINIIRKEISAYISSQKEKYNKASLVEFDVSCLDLRGLSFKEVDMSGVNAKKSNLAHVDFENAILARANLKNTNLTKAKFKNAVLIGADLRGAKFKAEQLAEVGDLKKLSGVKVSLGDKFKLYKAREIIKDREKAAKKIEKQTTKAERDSKISGLKQHYSNIIPSDASNDNTASKSTESISSDSQKSRMVTSEQRAELKRQLYKSEERSSLKRSISLRRSKTTTVQPNNPFDLNSKFLPFSNISYKSEKNSTETSWEEKVFTSKTLSGNNSEVKSI